MCVGQGFDIRFMGEEYIINLPRLVGKTADEALNDGKVFHFTHFSLVMNKHRRFLIYGANNVDKDLLKDINRSDDWHFASCIGEDNQVGNELYRNNPWDRGHMVRRRDVCWGTFEEAKKANHDSFCWANIVLQHCEVNQGIWNQIEDWMLDHSDNLLKKITIFTGPIFTDNDRNYCGVNRELGCGIQIPAGFWKVMFFVDSRQKLRSVAFIVKQDEFWFDDQGRRFNPLESYQVPLNTISQITGIEFENALYNTNSLFFRPNGLTESESIRTPEQHLIRSVDDIILYRDLT
jgi:endonuclease G